MRAAEGGEDPASRIIRFEGNKPITITDTGDVFQGEQNLGRIGLVNVENPDSLAKMGSSYYGFKPNMTPEIVNINNPRV